LSSLLAGKRGERSRRGSVRAIRRVAPACYSFVIFWNFENLFPLVRGVAVDEKGFFFFDQIPKVPDRFPGLLLIQMIPRDFGIEVIFPFG